MESGERVLLHVGWELGYGKDGNFSLPNVPPMADFFYDVEVIGFDETKEAIAYMGDDFMLQLFGKCQDMALAVKNPGHLNMAACLIKLKRYNEAIGHCNIVRPIKAFIGREEVKNSKALFRRGKAKAELGQMESARDDFRKAQRYAPDDKAIRRELLAVAEHGRAVYQKQKEMNKGIFGGMEERGAKAKTRNWLIMLWQWLVSLFCRIFRHHRVKTD